MGEMRSEYKILVLNPEGTVRNLLKWISSKQGGKMWSGFIWLRIGASGKLLWI
jgi:hypothetical protein